MIYVVREPPPALKGLVSLLWYGENSVAHAQEGLLPTGEFDLVVNARDGILRIYESSDLVTPATVVGPLLSGAQARSYVIDTAQQAALVGAKFRPGGAYAFGLPAHALRDRHIPLAELWGPAAAALQDRVMAATTPAERIGALEHALLARLPGIKALHPAVGYAVERFQACAGMAPVHAVATHVELSSHRFIDLFSREIGLAPKLYCRLLRFKHVLRAIDRTPSADLTSIAIDCGYYDQSHMIREFKEFAGVTPSAFRAVEGRYDNHLPLRR